MLRSITAFSLVAAILGAPAVAHAQQTASNNRAQLSRIGWVLSAAGAAMVGAAAVRGDWETRRCPNAGESWRDVAHDRELCALLRNETLAHLKPKPDWTLTAMGGATVAVGLFTVLLSRRFPKSPDISIRITSTGVGISRTFLW